jgi:hypothetical protein
VPTWRRKTQPCSPDRTALMRGDSPGARLSPFGTAARQALGRADGSDQRAVTPLGAAEKRSRLRSQRRDGRGGLTKAAPRGSRRPLAPCQKQYSRPGNAAQTTTSFISRPASETSCLPRPGLGELAGLTWRAGPSDKVLVVREQSRLRSGHNRGAMDRDCSRNEARLANWHRPLAVGSLAAWLGSSG